MRQDTHKKVFCSSVRHNIQIHINSARQCSEARHNHLMHTSSIVPLQSFGKRFNHFLHKAISVPSVTIICCTLQSLCPRNHLMHTSITLCKCNQCALSYNHLMHTSSIVPLQSLVHASIISCIVKSVWPHWQSFNAHLRHCALTIIWCTLQSLLA